MIAKDYQCPACGATRFSKVLDCCDYCLLTLFSGEHSPELNTAFEKYNSVADWTNDPTDYNDEDDNNIFFYFSEESN